MQVMTFTALIIDADGFSMRTRPAMRHLKLDTGILTLLRRVNLQAFTQLETLRLCSWMGIRDPKYLTTEGIPPFYNVDLDLSRLQSLRCLHIVDWSSRSISVIASCQVHAVWQVPVRGGEWLLSPCWQDPGTALASLQVNAGGDTLTSVHTHAIQTLVKCQTALQLLSIRSGTLGSREVPFTFPRECIERLQTPLKVIVYTTHGCWIDNNIPLRRTNIHMDFKLGGPLHVVHPDGHVRSELRWPLV